MNGQPAKFFFNGFKPFLLELSLLRAEIALLVFRDKLIDAAAISREFSKRVGDRYYDPADLFLAAARNAGEFQARLGTNTLFIYGLYDFTRVQALLIKAVAEKADIKAFMPFHPSRAFEFAERGRQWLLSVPGMKEVEAEETERVNSGLERLKRALARAEARTKVQQEARVAIEKEKLGRENLRNVRERLASILTPVIVIACAVWIALLGFTNVRARREEIGVLRTLGVSAKSVFTMFLSKHILVGVLGGALGFCAGVFAAVYFGGALEDTKIGISEMNISLVGFLFLSIAGAAVLAVLAGWIPTLTAIRQDPAEVLREE